MLQRLLLLAFVLGFSHLHGQTETLHSLTAAPRAQPLEKTTADTINVPWADDFSYPSAVPSSKFWTDAKALVNQSFGVDEITMGVATLDGLDEIGYAYNPAINTSDTLADVLTSRYINLQPSATGVVISFYYQNAGRGDVAEANDTLVLDFWSPVTSQWSRAWEVNGGAAMSSFKAAAVEVTGTDFLQPGFRFRFGGKGALNGQFDVWNIDYVSIGAGRTLSDTLTEDPGFTRFHPSILNLYTAMPAAHYQDTLFQKSAYDVYYRKNGPPGSASINLRKFILSYNGSPISTQNGVPFNTDPFNVENLITIPFGTFDIPGPRPQEFNLTMETIMDGANDGIRTNDTLRLTQTFRNYYAYDDGSAEVAYGIVNFAGAKQAMRWQPVQADTLKGLYIYFAQAGINQTNTGFKIGLWADVQGAPGTLIYLSDSVYKPQYSQTNVYLPYALDVPQYVQGSVFIGLQQTGTIPLNIGFDRNIVNASDLYYGNSTTWFQSLFQGTLMLRPYVGYEPLDLASPEWSEVDFELFPNPARQVIHVHGLLEPAPFRLYNLQGKVVFEWSLQAGNNSLQLPALPVGLYVAEVGQTRKKLLIQP